MERGRVWDRDPELRVRGEAERAAHIKAQRRFPLTRFKDVQVGASRNYLVKELIPRAGLIVCYGAPKCGKTFVITDLVLHVSLGWDYRGRRVQQGAVVYIACEGERGLASRLEAFRHRFLSPKEKTEFAFSEEDTATADPPFFLVATRLDLVAEVELLMREIKAQIGDAPPVAIVVDTLNRSLRGSESDDRDMGAYIKAADCLREAFECAVIIIHHSGIEKDRPRGHTSLAGAVDAQLHVKRKPNDEIVLRVELMKDGGAGDEVASKLEVVEIGLDADGEPMTSCVVVPSGEGQSRRPSVALSPRQRRARELLESTIEQDGQVIDEPGDKSLVPKRVKVAPLDRWREECYFSLPVDSTAGRDAEQEAKRKAFMRVRKDLADKGVIKESGGWVWLVS